MLEVITDDRYNISVGAYNTPGASSVFFTAGPEGTNVFEAWKAFAARVGKDELTDKMFAFITKHRILGKELVFERNMSAGLFRASYLSVYL